PAEFFGFSDKNLKRGAVDDGSAISIAYARTAVSRFNHWGLLGTRSSKDWTCARPACRTIRGDGMARRARICWSFARITKPVGVRSIFCAGAKSRAKCAVCAVFADETPMHGPVAEVVGIGLA